jgi:hypothetical protein
MPLGFRTKTCGVCADIIHGGRLRIRGREAEVLVGNILEPSKVEGAVKFGLENK